MGILICEHHGRVGFVETCAHVANRIDGGRAPAGRRLSLLTNLLVCDECYGSLGFERFESLANLPLEESIETSDDLWDAYDAAYERIEGRRLFCVKCLAASPR